MQPSSHCCVNSSGSICRRGRQRFPDDAAFYKSTSKVSQATRPVMLHYMKLIPAAWTT